MSSGFVSEGDLDARRQKRQEEWEAVRKESDPKEAPEPEYDSRSLFERLEENRVKKQFEWEEAHKFKNQIRGIDDDEADFLDKVSNIQENIEKRIRNEELAEIQAYRLRLGRLSESEDRERITSEIKVTKGTPSYSKPPSSSQSNLIKSAVVKRPGSSLPSSTSDSKKSKSDQDHHNLKPPSLGALAGLGSYESSSEDED